MVKSRIFLYFCLAFVGGIFVSSFVFMPQLFLLGFSIVAIFFISVLWKFKKLVIAGFCLLFFVLGILRYQLAESKVIYPGEGRIAFTGIVAEEPEIRPSSIKLVLEQEEPSAHRLGRILVIAGRYPEYRYGDKLKITGILKIPQELESFNYKDYLKKDGIVAVMDFPEIELLDSGLGNPAMEVLLSFKDKFRSAARTFISPPQQGLLEALIFGQESNISQEWKDKLNFTGTRHIAAVSGMNTTIISSIIFVFILSLGFRKSQAFYLSIVLLFLYILMIGAPASAVRAFIMAVIFLLAKNLGRQSSGSRSIFFAATLMLTQNPFLLARDVGFQLSFLAISGLAYMQPFFSYYLRFIPNPKFFPVRTTLAATLAAQVFTLPILIYNFGYFSLISLVANILIVPALAPITILIFIFGISGMISHFLGFILSLPVWFSLTYIIKVIGWFSNFTFAFLTFENLHWVWLVVFYSILGGFVWWYNKYIWIKKLGW